MLRRALIFVLMVGYPVVCLAHDPGLSALEVRVERSRIVAELALAASDADAVSVGALENAVSAGIDEHALNLATRVVSRETGTVRVTFTWSRASGDRLVLVSRVASLLPSGHRQLVSVRAADGQPLAEQMLDATAAEVVADVRDSAAAPAAASFLWLGVEHIAGGFDHLLFVAALLLGVRRTSDAVKTVTAFTVAHSVTLAASTLGWVQLPPAVVEPAIAASIMYVAAENIVRGADGGRSRLTFVFGLIHGFGFAGALRELGVGESGAAIAVPLAAFNLGVEAGQVAVVVTLMPVLTRLRAYPTLAIRAATVGSALVFVAGTYWLVERVL
jgi:hypothetical protein